MTRELALKVLAELLDAFDSDVHGDYFYDHGWEVCEAAILAYGALERDARTDKYAQTEQDGRLVVLPCKAGDTVYGFLYDCADCPLGRNISIEQDICGDCQCGVVSDRQFEMSDLQFLNKTVFLTREEAEDALREVA